MKRAIAVVVLLGAFSASALAGTQTVEALLHDYLHIAPETIRATEGDTLVVTVTSPVENQGEHNFVVPAFGIRTDLLSPGNSLPPIEIPLSKSGTFEYFCDVPGHKEGGMVGTLIVDSKPAAEAPGGKSSPGLAALAVVGAALVTAVVVRGRRA